MSSKETPSNHNHKRGLTALFAAAALSTLALSACDYDYNPGTAVTLSPEEKAAKEQKAQELETLGLKETGTLDKLYDDEVPFGDKVQAFYTALGVYLEKAKENGIPTNSELHSYQTGDHSSCDIERLDDGRIAVHASTSGYGAANSASVFFDPEGISYVVSFDGHYDSAYGDVDKKRIGLLGIEINSIQATFTNPDAPCLLDGDFLVRALVPDQDPSSGGGGGAGSSAS